MTGYTVNSLTPLHEFLHYQFADALGILPLKPNVMCLKSMTDMFRTLRRHFVSRIGFRSELHTCRCYRRAILREEADPG